MTLSGTLATQIDTNYGAMGGGGSEPTYIKELDTLQSTTPYNHTQEFILIWEDVPLDREQFNDKFVTKEYELTILVSTPTSATRLDEISTEVIAIINSSDYVLTGIDMQYVVQESRTTNRHDQYFTKEIKAKFFQLLVSSDVAFGTNLIDPSYFFMTVAGITTDVVATTTKDTLTLSASDSIVSMIGNAVTKTIDFTIPYVDQDLKIAASPTFAALTVSGNITVTGNVDGVDVAALKTDVDGFPDALKNLATAEIGQLENIGAETISAGQWGYLGALDQSLIQAATPTFAGLTIVNPITEFSVDASLTDNLDTALVSEKAIKTYVDNSVGAGGHTHDTETLQLDGINSDGGAFPFTTTGPVTFNQDVIIEGDSLPFYLKRQSSTVGAGLGLTYSLWNASSAYVDYAKIVAEILANTAGSESGQLDFFVMSAGALTERMTLDKDGNLQMDGNLTVSGGQITVQSPGSIKSYSDAAISHYYYSGQAATPREWRIIVDDSPSFWGLYDATLGTYAFKVVGNDGDFDTYRRLNLNTEAIVGVTSLTMTGAIATPTSIITSGNLTAANIVTAGNVDGVDISAWLDQSVKTTANPTFGITTIGELNTDASDCVINLSAQEIASHLSDGVSDVGGGMQFTATGQFFKYSIPIPYKFAGGIGKVVSIKYNYSTDDVNAYVNSSNIYRASLVDGSINYVIQDSTDKGNGSTGNSNWTHTTNYTLTGETVFGTLSFTITSGNVIIRGITITWELD